VTDYFAQFAKRDEAQQALIGTVVNGREYTEQDYKQWRLAQIGRGKRFKALRDRLAERMTRANQVAAAYINDATPGIYALNRNFAAYTIEQQVGADVGFDIWDEQTVKRLIVEQPDLMPYYPPARAVKRGIDLAYGKRQITAQVTSGILQGESVPKLADRLQTNIPNMNRASAIRAARTAVTGAQNGGRQDSYNAAAKMGIKLQKQWLATLDNRTRHSHGAADGQSVAEDEPFNVGGYELMYPGDPKGPAHEIYNCRCTTIAKVKGVDTSDAKRRARDLETGESAVIENVSYAQWAEGKKKAGKVYLQNQADSDTIRHIKIVPETIENLPYVEIPGIGAEASRKIHEECKDLLREAAKHPVGTEVGAICDLQGNRKWRGVGESADGAVHIPDAGFPHITIHNHPDGLFFSKADIEHFIFNENMDAMVVAGNNGRIYTIVKGEEYDGMDAIRKFVILEPELQLFLDDLNIKGYIHSIHVFLKGGEEYGLKFIEKGTR